MEASNFRGAEFWASAAEAPPAADRKRAKSRNFRRGAAAAALEGWVAIPARKRFELRGGFKSALLFSTGNGGEAVIARVSLARSEILELPDQLETKLDLAGGSGRGTNDTSIRGTD